MRIKIFLLTLKIIKFGLDTMQYIILFNQMAILKNLVILVGLPIFLTQNVLNLFPLLLLIMMIKIGAVVLVSNTTAPCLTDYPRRHSDSRGGNYFCRQPRPCRQGT